MKNCNNCEYINLTEEQQHKTARGEPHICTKYKRRVFHRSSRPGYHEIIYPCYECMSEHEDKKKASDA